MVRAKMYVVGIDGNKLKLSCQYDYDSKEDQSFMKATPWGSAEFGIDNQKALDYFKVGKSYYLDFTEA